MEVTSLISNTVFVNFNIILPNVQDLRKLVPLILFSDNLISSIIFDFGNSI